MSKYYRLPLDLEAVVERRPLRTCSLRESIAQHLYLLLTTQFGEARFEPGYGCQVWEQDFDAITTVRWRDTVQESVEQAILRYEPRLLRPRVQVEVTDFELKNVEQRIRRRLNVIMTGILCHTDEPLDVRVSLFLAPLAMS